MDYYPKMSRLLWITIQKSHDLVKTNEIVISKISKFVLPKSRNSAAIPGQRIEDIDRDK